MLNSKGLRKLQNKLGLKKLANNGNYKVLLDPNTGVAVLVDNDGNFVYLPKPKDTNSPEWNLYLFLVNYNNRLNSPYKANEEGGVPIVFGADILGSQLLRKYVRPGNPLHGESSFTKNDTYNQLVYDLNPDNPINLYNVIKNLAFADAEFRGMHFGSAISPHSDPTSVDFGDIFRAHKSGTAARSGLLTHLNLSVVNPEDTSTITTNPLHNWYASEIEDDLRLRGFPEQLILARPTSDVDTIAGRAAESPFDTTFGGWSLLTNQAWSSVFGDNAYIKTMQEIERAAKAMGLENRFTRFVPMHQQAAYRTLRELERKGQLNDPFFVNGNMFYIAPTTVNENEEELLVWNPNSTFVDLANRKDLELLNIERALANEYALTEAINAINATMYEGSLIPTFSSPEAQLLFTVLDNNRREFYLLDDPKILEDGRKLLYDVDKMPAAYKSILPYYSAPKNNLLLPNSSVSSLEMEDIDRTKPLHYRIPSLSDFALFLNEDVNDYTGRKFIDSAGRQFVTQSNDLPLYRHTSDNLDPIKDAEAYTAINGANYGWLNRNYGLHPIYGNPYALLVTGGILESAYLRKRDSDQLLSILSGLKDSDINYGIELNGNRDSTRPTPYLYHYLSYMGFDPSTARVPSDGNLFGLQVFDNPGGAWSTDTIMNSDRIRHMRTSDFSHDWEGWWEDAGKWVQNKAVTNLGGTKSEGKTLGEVTKLVGGIFNPQMFMPALMETPVGWMDGTGALQRLVDFDKLGRLYGGADLTIGENADYLLDLDSSWTLNAAYLGPNSALAGLPQLILADITTLPVAKVGARAINLIGSGIRSGIRKLRGTPPATSATSEFVATKPIIAGKGPSILNDLSALQKLRVSQSGNGLVYDGNPITLSDLNKNNALVRNSKGLVMRAADLENAAKNGANLDKFYRTGDLLTLTAAPGELAAVYNGMIPLSLSDWRFYAANALDLGFFGGTIPNMAYNWVHPFKTLRNMRYAREAAKASRSSSSKTPWYKPDFSWKRVREQLLGETGPKKTTAYSYDPKTNTLVSGKPVLGLIGVNGGSKWNPQNWYGSLVYDSKGNIRPVVRWIVGPESYSRYNSINIPHIQANVDPRLTPNNRLEPGELINTADYYTPSTYNGVIDEYANNDYINRNKLPGGKLTVGTSPWPWMAIGGAGLGLGLLLSNRKKEEEEKRKRKKLMQLRRLQLANYYNEYPY